MCLAEVTVKWLPSCLGDWHAGLPSLAFGPGKPGSYTHASASLSAFVILLPLVSLPACVSRPRAGVLYQTQWHKYIQLGWQGTQRAFPDGPLPRLVLAVLVQGSEELFMQLCVPLGQGKSWVSAFHPQAGSPMDPPGHTPIRCIPNPTPPCQREDTGKPHTPVYSLIDRGFGICEFPFCLEGSAPNQHPQHPGGHIQACRVQHILIAPPTFPTGPGKVTPCLLWALRQHTCPFHCLLAGTNLRIFPARWFTAGRGLTGRNHCDGRGSTVPYA